ncbi:hypothetical protein CsSME_00002260 [Camellia sinensis var. sinensis]
MTQKLEESSARMGKLPEKGIKFVGSISGWTATLLFMWMPVAQMWTNFLNPDNIKGLSAVSMLLAMIGNGLMIPRALFIRDFMWYLVLPTQTLFILPHLCKIVVSQFLGFIELLGRYLMIVFYIHFTLCGGGTLTVSTFD